MSDYMPYMDSAVQENLRLIKESVLKVIPDTETIYLFGSFVNGTPHKDSDLDICVIAPDNVGRIIDLQAEVRGELSDTSFDMPMDLLIKRSAKFHQRKQVATFDKVIAREGVVIYG